MWRSDRSRANGTGELPFAVKLRELLPVVRFPVVPGHRKVAACQVKVPCVHEGAGGGSKLVLHWEEHDPVAKRSFRGS